jgi:hypothetical protein
MKLCQYAGLILLLDGWALIVWSRTLLGGSN